MENGYTNKCLPKCCEESIIDFVSDIYFEEGTYKIRFRFKNVSKCLEFIDFSLEGYLYGIWENEPARKYAYIERRKSDILPHLSGGSDYIVSFPLSDIENYMRANFRGNSVDVNDCSVKVRFHYREICEGVTKEYYKEGEYNDHDCWKDFDASGVVITEDSDNYYVKPPHKEGVVVSHNIFRDDLSLSTFPPTSSVILPKSLYDCGKYRAETFISCGSFTCIKHWSFELPCTIEPECCLSAPEIEVSHFRNGSRLQTKVVINDPLSFECYSSLIIKYYLLADEPVTDRMVYERNFNSFLATPLASETYFLVSDYLLEPIRWLPRNTPYRVRIEVSYVCNNKASRHEYWIENVTTLFCGDKYFDLVDTSIERVCGINHIALQYNTNIDFSDSNVSITFRVRYFHPYTQNIVEDVFVGKRLTADNRFAYTHPDASIPPGFTEDNIIRLEHYYYLIYYDLNKQVCRRLQEERRNLPLTPYTGFKMFDTYADIKFKDGCGHRLVIESEPINTNLNVLLQDLYKQIPEHSRSLTFGNRYRDSASNYPCINVNFSCHTDIINQNLDTNTFLDIRLSWTRQDNYRVVGSGSFDITYLLNHCMRHRITLCVKELFDLSGVSYPSISTHVYDNHQPGAPNIFIVHATIIHCLKTVTVNFFTGQVTVINY